MSTPVTPSNPSPAGPAGDDRNLVPVDATTAVSFEEKLEIFWQKYRGAVFGVCALVIVAILGKGGWEYLQRQKEAEVKKAYAAAATAEQLKAFSAATPDHPLAAVAQVRIADEAYTAGKGAEAVAAYDKALTIAKDGPLAVRAKLGRAVAKVSAGKASEASAELAQLANDANTFKGVRAEAAYHLTSLAVEAKNAADAQKYSDLLMQIDPTSPWTQRGLALRASLPAPAATAAAPAAGDAAAPKVEVKLPGAK
jgi:hypothetical protein